jgi:hypothetical protein
MFLSMMASSVIAPSPARGTGTHVSLNQRELLYTRPRRRDTLSPAELASRVVSWCEARPSQWDAGRGRQWRVGRIRKRLWRASPGTTPPLLTPNRPLTGDSHGPGRNCDRVGEQNCQTPYKFVANRSSSVKCAWNRQTVPQSSAHRMPHAAAPSADPVVVAFLDHPAHRGRLRRHIQFGTGRYCISGTFCSPVAKGNQLWRSSFECRYHPRKLVPRPRIPHARRRS